MTGAATGPTETTVALDGEWDIARREELRTLLFAELATLGDAGTFVLDLRATQFVDSCTLGVFLSARRRVQARKGRMITVATPGTLVHRVIEIAGLTDFLGVLEA